MRSVPLGATGEEIPEFGLGTYLYTGGPEPLVAGIEAGAILIDTAPLYLSEDVVGDALRGRRAGVFLATKVGGHHARPDDLVASAERSLAALGTDHVDLLQLHWPNPDVPIAETVGALEALADAGKVRYLGLSNFSVPEIAAAQAAAGRHRFVSNQVQYCLVQRWAETAYNPNGLAGPDDGDVLSYCRHHDITVIAWGPLGMGRLLRDDDDRPPAQLIRSIAAEMNATPAQVALNWCTARGGTVAIPKSNGRQHLLENLGAADWRLTPEQLAQLDQAFAKYRDSAIPGRACDYLAQWAEQVEATGQQL